MGSSNFPNEVRVLRLAMCATAVWSLLSCSVGYSTGNLRDNEIDAAIKEAWDYQNISTDKVIIENNITKNIQKNFPLGTNKGKLTSHLSKIGAECGRTGEKHHNYGGNEEEIENYCFYKVDIPLFERFMFIMKNIGGVRYVVSLYIYSKDIILTGKRTKVRLVRIPL